MQIRARGAVPAHGQLLICFVAVVAVAAPGCTSESVDRYPVRGTVSFNGKPVDSGMIIFEATESAGRVAPTVYLPIRDGKYDAGSEGPTKGKYRVAVGGFDRAHETTDSEGLVHTPSLFPEYRIEAEIPPPNNTLNIEIPANRKNPRK